MERPFARLGMDALETLFGAAQRIRDNKRLTSLAAELECRSTNRAAELLLKVQCALAEAVPTANASPCQPELDLIPTRMVSPLNAVATPSGISTPLHTSSPAQSATRFGQTPTRPQKSETTAPTMNLTEAARLLGVKVDAPWELIEQARFKLVNLSSPTVTAKLPDAERIALMHAATRANEAFLALVIGRAC